MLTDHRDTYLTWAPVLAGRVTPFPIWEGAVFFQAIA